MNEKEKFELLKRLEEHLKLKNYSKDTLKAYLIHVKKYFEFLKDKNPNFQNSKEYILKKLENDEPSSVHHSIYKKPIR